jgi:hypothetical protein
MWKVSIGILLIAAFVSCSPSHNNLNTGVPTLPLIPLAEGNTWIYTDTIFASAGDTIYQDTVSINGNAIEFSSQNGNVPFYGVTETDTTGIFSGGQYLGLDPSNTAIYQYDSVFSSQPYVYFATANADGTNLGTGSQQDPVTPSCTDLITQYGYVSTTVINGHTCLKNILYVTNCSNTQTEADVIYIDPGIGLVRFENYELNGSGTLALVFSQTLASDNLQ